MRYYRKPSVSYYAYLNAVKTLRDWAGPLLQKIRCHNYFHGARFYKPNLSWRLRVVRELEPYAQPQQKWNIISRRTHGTLRDNSWQARSR